MTTKQEYALALEIALGAGMQNIVVDREEDAKAASRVAENVFAADSRENP